jgi:hypothetical protein
MLPSNPALPGCWLPVPHCRAVPRHRRDKAGSPSWLSSHAPSGGSCGAAPSVLRRLSNWAGGALKALVALRVVWAAAATATLDINEAVSATVQLVAVAGMVYVVADAAMALLRCGVRLALSMMLRPCLGSRSRCRSCPPPSLPPSLHPRLPASASASACRRDVLVVDAGKPSGAGVAGSGRSR